MKRSRKKVLIAASVLVALGLVLCLGTLVAIDFDLTRLNATMQLAEGPDGPIQFGIYFGG